jgi:hypothetical protein
MWGPVFAYNAACLLAVALAGWCAFILCRYVTSAYWPSIFGGYVFGFSAYMLGQTAAHLDLILVFPVPLFVWLLIQRFYDGISRTAFILGLTLTLTAQFLLSIELFATMTLFAAIAFALEFILGLPSERTRIAGVLRGVALSYAITGILLSPYFYFMIALGYESGISHPPLLYSTDLLNLIVPTPTMWLGRLIGFRTIAGHFLGYIYEADAYIGIPLLILAAAFAWQHRSTRRARMLFAFFIIAVVLSFGPLFIVNGSPIFPAPAIMIAVLPLIGKALPARLMLYAFLALAMMSALWMSDGHNLPWLRVTGALAIMISMFPNPSSGFWMTTIDNPPFFNNRLYGKYLVRNETVIVLPYGYNGNSVLWQLNSQWRFRMAGGNVGPPPLAFRRWPVVRAFYRVGTYVLPDAGDQLRAFLAGHQAHAVIVADREAAVWRPLMATLDVAPIHAGGMTLYRVPAAELAPWKKATALEMETRAAHARFAALLVGAEAMLRGGHTPASLTPAEVLKTRGMPRGWVIVPPKIQPQYAEGGLNLPRAVPNPHSYAGMWLAADKNGAIEIGIEGWYPALRAVLDDYRNEAIAFTPHDLADAGQDAIPNRRGMLVMTFNHKGLQRAAAVSQDLVSRVRDTRHIAKDM